MITGSDVVTLILVGSLAFVSCAEERVSLRLVEVPVRVTILVFGDGYVIVIGRVLVLSLCSFVLVVESLDFVSREQ